MPWNMPTTNPSCCIGFPPQQGCRQHYSEYSWTRDSDDYSDVGIGGTIPCPGIFRVMLAAPLLRGSLTTFARHSLISCHALWCDWR